MHTLAVAYAAAFGCLVVIYVFRRYLGSTRSSCPSPPGPPGIPWIGNVFGINTNAPWLTYSEWAKTYGDIIYSRLLGKDIIIINSEEIAKDLLDTRSSNYSDRPHLVTSELCGVDFNSALMPYGNRWRLHRRFFHQTFRVDAVQRFLPFQHHKACQFLRQLFSSPTRFNEHVFEYTAAVVLNGAYNYDLPSHDDRLIKIVTKVQEIILSAVRPNTAIIVGTFPILLRLPAWLPGMSFRTRMAHARELAGQYVEMAFEYSLQRVRDCSIAPSMVHDAMRSMEEKGEIADESWTNGLKESTATAFLAGSETSYSLLMTFIYMMMLNPAVQETARAQIDAVVGKDRLPTVDDRPLLPFVDAILRETVRYNPVVPLSIPHAAVNEDTYRGFHIPKGAILLPNLWAMAHNESKYPNPHVFKPERFLNDDGSLTSDDVDHIAYGFGRRICPGKHLADMSLWSLIAKVLAVFKILKPLDENGVEISIEPKFATGIAVHPLPFQCRIVPRFTGMDRERLEDLIAATIP